MIFLKKKKTKLFVFIILTVLLGQKSYAQPRIIEFSNYSWLVKSANRKQAPGPNWFTNDIDLVWVDSKGDLHLTIKKLRNNQWFCSEIISRRRFGYGIYTIEIQSDVSVLDPNVVLGLFTYDTSDFEQNYSELDIEFSRWGDPKKPLGNFTAQPYTEPANSRKFDIPPGLDQSTHEITWMPGEIRFASYRGFGKQDKTYLINQWIYKGGSIPVPKKPGFRLNLWLFKSAAPMKSMEIVIHSFQFTPLE